MDWSKAIKVDQHIEPEYGHDQANVNYPAIFPTVRITLEVTDELFEAAGTEDIDEITIISTNSNRSSVSSMSSIAFVRLFLSKPGRVSGWTNT